MFLAALAAQPAPAQQPLVTQPLDSGAVVRLRLRDGAREGAKLLTRFGPDSDTLFYCRWPALPCTLGSERHVVRPATAVLGLETYRGSRAKLGAIISAIVGVPMGFGELGAELCGGTAECSLSSPERSRRECVGCVPARSAQWAFWPPSLGAVSAPESATPASSSTGS